MCYAYDSTKINKNKNEVKKNVKYMSHKASTFVLYHTVALHLHLKYSLWFLTKVNNYS